MQWDKKKNFWEKVFVLFRKKYIFIVKCQFYQGSRLILPIGRAHNFVAIFFLG